MMSQMQAADFTTHAPKLKFLSSWQPVLRYPGQQSSQEPVTGYKELYGMGVTYRFRYTDF